jgi:hypothetical protein
MQDLGQIAHAFAAWQTAHQRFSDAEAGLAADEYNEQNRGQFSGTLNRAQVQSEYTQAAGAKQVAGRPGSP